MRLSFAQTPGFVADWRREDLADEDLRLLELSLMENPNAGPVMPGTNGARKMRFAPRSGHRGKSGAYRVIYVHLPSHEHVWLMMLFGKNVQANITADERKAIGAYIAEIKQSLAQPPQRSRR